MFEEINENISRLVDDELGHNETLDLLKKMQSDEVLKRKMIRYQAISQALKTDKFYQVSPDFSRKVFQEIQQEPTHFLPQLRPKPAAVASDKYNKHKLYAVAASTLVIAVLVGQNVHTGQSVSSHQTVSAMVIPQQSVPVSLTQSDKQKQRNRQPLNSQFNDYLQAHNSSVYTNGEANFQPYARVASYGKD